MVHKNVKMVLSIKGSENWVITHKRVVSAEQKWVAIVIARIRSKDALEWWWSVG